MRPTPAESIAGIRRVLVDVIRPELQTDFAMVNFDRCVAALEEIERRAPDAIQLLRQDIHDLSAVLATVGAEGLGAERDVDDPQITYDELHARYVELRTVASNVLDADRADGSAMGVDEVRAYLRRAVNRGLGL